MSYTAALLAPELGQWLRRVHSLSLGAAGNVPLHTTRLLLCLVLFSAGLQVPVRALGTLLRRPTAMLAGLTLHLTIPLVAIPAVALMLRQTSDTDGGSGLVAAMILIVAMPVAAGATVWTGKGAGDQPTMVGLVLASTLLSPFSTPLVIHALLPHLSDSYAHTLTSAESSANATFAFVDVVLPCAAGLLCRLALPALALKRLISAIVPLALAGSFVLTYVNASGAFGSFLDRPRPALLAGAIAVAALVCLMSMAVGRTAARMLRLEASTAASLTLACGMNNSSASAVLISSVLPDKPHLLLPVLAYGLIQKTAANRVVRPKSSSS
ncbi:bile acid:sodium symporter family protein [Streptomyces siamensis]|uniref:Sodium-dependent transporter n=1 Tax=Streptomyces siamensis TaxID=1274986 RepID=A0ABP9JDQ1_9ACTN